MATLALSCKSRPAASFLFLGLLQLSTSTHATYQSHGSAEPGLHVCAVAYALWPFISGEDRQLCTLQTKSCVVRFCCTPATDIVCAALRTVQISVRASQLMVRPFTASHRRLVADTASVLDIRASGVASKRAALAVFLLTTSPLHIELARFIWSRTNCINFFHLFLCAFLCSICALFFFSFFGLRLRPY